MPKTKQQKEETVKMLADKMKEAKSLIFINFRGLKVKEVEELRRKCRQEEIDYLVAKKTLINLAFKESGLNDISSKKLENEVATVFGIKDEVTPAKIIQDFAKSHESLNIIGGLIEGKFISREKIIELSKLPSKDQLLSMVIGSIKAPVSGFVNVLSGNLRSLLYVLNAVKDSKN